MRLRAIVLAIVTIALASPRASAVETYSSTQFRKLIAHAVVPDRDSEQLYFSVMAGTFWRGEVRRWAPADGIYYQYSGTVDLDADGKTTTLRPGDGIFLASGTRFTVRTDDLHPGPTYLQFLLSSTPELTAIDAADGSAVEIYRSPSPIPTDARSKPPHPHAGPRPAPIPARSAPQAHGRGAPLCRLRHGRRTRGRASGRARAGNGLV